MDPVARPWFLLYDAHCGLCRSFAYQVRWLNRLALHDGRVPRLEFAGLESEAAGALLAPLPLEQATASFHLVDPTSRIHSGAEAMVPLLGLLPGSEVSSSVVRQQPALEGILRHLYVACARLREGGQCRIP